MVHTSYLSRVLSEKVHLTPDQGANLCEFWHLTDLESDFFLTLLSQARAGSPILRRVLTRQLKELRRKNDEVARRFQGSRLIESQDFSVYYSAWYFTAIHLLLMVRAYQTPEALAERLRLPIELIDSALGVLEKIGLAEKSGGTWRALEKRIHTQNSSHWTSVQHSNWRVRTAQAVFERDPQALHFTGVHAISRKDFARIKRMMLDLAEEVGKIAIPSKEEDAFCLAMDWYRV